MRTKVIRIVLVGLASLLFLAVAWRFQHRSPRNSKVAATLEPSSPAANSIARNSAQSRPNDPLIPPSPKAALPAGSSPPSRNSPVPNTPEEPVLVELDQINLMIRDYRTLAGENPVGTNAEIMAALMGKNSKHAQLGPPAGARFNDKGELLDRWGTPYFFHQLSGDHMEIRSAGPDKVMWTQDDPVIP